MRWLILSVLAGGNVLGLVILCGLLSFGHAQSGLGISDLTYGFIDVDGDGAYTYGDDWLVERLLDTDRDDILRKAVSRGSVNADGGVDISPFLSSLTAERLRPRKN